MNSVIWSLPIRILHGLMAIFITINLFIFDEGELLHVLLGYAALAIVLIRLIIGIKTNDESSFKKFPLNYNEVFLFLKNIFSRKRPQYKGHNPLASYAFILFWIAVIILGVTGILLEHVDHFWGDPVVQEIHTITSDAVIIFLIIHLAGITLDSILHRRRTWMAMITGKRS